MFNNTEMKCSNFGNYSTVRFVGVCYPLNETFAETIDLGLNFYDEAIADLQHTWPISLATIFTTFFLSIVLMFFIRACGGCLVISVIILYFALIIAFGVVAISASKGQIDIPIPTDLQDPQLL